MKIKILISLLSLFFFQLCNKQNVKITKTTKQNLPIAIGDDFKSATSLLLYKFNEKKMCDQSKAVSIIMDNKISQCFDLIKNINGLKTKEILNILHDKNTYGSEDAACFDTDYSLVVMNGKTIIGYINISLRCNKLFSNPIIKEETSHSKNGLTKIGFSNYGRNKLLKLLGI